MIGGKGELRNRCIHYPWVTGTTYTICDPYLFTLVGWMQTDGIDSARFPKVHDHRKRMSERSAVKSVPTQEAAPAV